MINVMAALLNIGGALCSTPKKIERNHRAKIYGLPYSIGRP